MATVNKDFKIKSGLIVEGTTATVNGYDVLTKKTEDQNYIIDLIGGSATSAATPDTVVLRDEDANFAANNVTINTLYVGGSTNNGIDVVGGDTEVGSTNGILLSANDDITLGTSGGDIVLNTTSGTSYINSKSANNQIATKGYVDGEISTLDTTAAGYATTAQTAAEATASADATTKANAAQAAAELTASNALSSAVTNLEGQISDAETNANTYTNTAITNLNLSNTYDAKGAAATALSSANTYTDGKVADLVDSAPDLLNTLNELAAAIADNPNYATDVANLVATKADTTYVNDEISAVDTAAQGYASTAQSNAESFATTAANNAQTAAETFASGLSVNYDAAGAASAAQTAAESFASGLDSATNTRIDNLDTDDVAEGTAQYFTDARAKSSAADLLTGANLTNITITGTGAGLTITAENGVADSTTSDLREGTNLYFTAQRAVDALEAVVPNFTAVELNSVAKQVAATLSAPTAGIQVAHAFDKTDYRSAEYLVKVAYGTHTEISKVLLTLDSSDNIAITEYGIVGTNGSASSISAGISGSNVQLQVTTSNNNSTVTVVGTLVA